MGQFISSVQTDVLTTAQLFTASWVDVGSEISVSGVDKLKIYLEIDKSDSSNFRIKPLALLSKGDSDEYGFSIQSVGASDVKLEDLYYEFNVDADRKNMFELELGGGVQYIQFQIQVGTIGTGTAELEHLKVVKIYK